MAIQRRCGRERQADDRAVPARHLHRRHRLPAGLRAAGLRVDRAAVDLPHRPGPGARRLLGRPAVAAGAERAAEPPRLVRDAGPARRAGRLHHRQRRCSPSCYASLSTGRLPGLGLALSVLRRLRDQRGGAVRAPAAGGRPTNTSACSTSASWSPPTCVELVRSQGSNLVIGAFAALASYALFHLVTVFPLSWITLYSHAVDHRVPRASR